MTLWSEVIPQPAYLGRFYHFMEDPRNYEFHEECKRKQQVIGKSSAVVSQVDQVKQSRKRKFTVETLARLVVKLMWSVVRVPV
jgi:hypothetical protein